ncbi:hypothetical protein FHS31_001661 [Sphingomonas vulcanisoli]|uniref:Uncharacterized protein n=1 Tax=Sphingomonas vulcanisoli TaxID=1658060 RepID=A0ABX0TWR1_9SPHN|nr:hypothetical protein [Sphingomonas vulcanisoli]
MEQAIFPKAALGPALLMGTGVWAALIALIHVL